MRNLKKFLTKGKKEAYWGDKKFTILLQVPGPVSEWPNADTKTLVIPNFMKIIEAKKAGFLLMQSVLQCDRHIQISILSENCTVQPYVLTANVL
jgi:hypothetical protein